MIEPRPLPVAPALQPSLPSPAPIWPSVRFLSRSAPVAARSTTQRVGRPQLTLACQAPEAVDLGAQVRYRLVIRNTGDGVAEQVVVEPQVLVGGGSRASTAKRFPVGDVPPGASREITLRDLARHAESLHVRFFATDLNGSEAAAEARVAVRRPDVEISLHGPSQLRLGDQAVFEIRAVNAGSGAAEPVRVLCSARDGLRLTVLDQQVQFATQPRANDLGHRPVGRRRNQSPAAQGSPGDGRRACDSRRHRERVGRSWQAAPSSSGREDVTVRDGTNDRTASWQPKRVPPARG